MFNKSFFQLALAVAAGVLVAELARGFVPGLKK